MAKRPPSESPAEPTEAEREAAARLAQTMTSAWILVNQAIYPDGRVDIPDEMRKRIPPSYPGPPIVLAMTTEMIANSVFVLTVGQHEDFHLGDPVLFLPVCFDVLPERKHAGQRLEEAQKSARDGFYVVLALAVERIRAALEVTNRVEYDVEEGRRRAREKLPFHLPYIPHNAFREGQKRLKDWHPELSSHEALKPTFMAVKDNAKRFDLTRLIQSQCDQVSLAAAVYLRTNDTIGAQREMSEAHRSEEPLSRSQLEMLANARDENIRLYDVMCAAIMMDLDPTFAFANYASYKDEFECGRLLARLGRGGPVTLTPEKALALERLFALAALHDDNPSAASEDQHVGALVRQYALHHDADLGRWRDRFGRARDRGEEVSLEPT